MSRLMASVLTPPGDLRGERKWLTVKEKWELGKGCQISGSW